MKALTPFEREDEERYKEMWKQQSKARRQDESLIQIRCVRWFRLQYPRLATLLFSVPNGGSRNVIEASRMKEEGVTAGVADLLLLYPNREYHGLCVEMKTPTGKQQPNQKLWQQNVEAVGYRYVVCRSLDEFMNVIKNYLGE